MSKVFQSSQEGTEIARYPLCDMENGIHEIT
jgi:hypothetical protein